MSNKIVIGVVAALTIAGVIGGYFYFKLTNTAKESSSNVIKNSNMAKTQITPSTQNTTGNLSNKNFFVFCPPDWIQNERTEDGEYSYSCANPKANSAGISSNIMVTEMANSSIPNSSQKLCENFANEQVKEINKNNTETVTSVISAEYSESTYLSCSIMLDTLFAANNSKLITLQKSVKKKGSDKEYLVVGMYADKDTQDMNFVENALDGFVVR
jgi:hypothetical protein